MAIAEQQEKAIYVQTSLAGAMALGLEPGRFYRNAYPRSLNLLLACPGGCRANCSYCGLARGRSPVAAEQTFIRVKWPEVELSVITGILEQQAAAGGRQFGRICVSMITHEQAAAGCLAVVKRLRQAVDIPISVLVAPTLIADIPEFFCTLKQAGVDRAGVAIDAATPELFVRFRGQAVQGPHSWSKYWQTLGQAVRIFGRDCASAHFIAGLGESEQDMVQALALTSGLGAQAHLFSFYAEPGSALAGCQPPELGRYRRIQLAAYLLNHRLIGAENIRFNRQGQIVGFGRPLVELLGVDLAGGKPFMTAGCPDSQGCVACNRPFGNERPGPVLRNYPVVPDSGDLAVIRRQIWSGLQSAEEDDAFNVSS